MFHFTMKTIVLLLVCFLKHMSVEARPQMTSFSILQGSSRWDIGEPRILPDLDEILALTLPQSLEKFKSTGFSYCNKLMTLNPREVFTVTFPVDRRSCLIYLRAPKGYLLEQRSHPIVRFSPCNKEQLRFSSGLNTLVYCDGGHAVHFQGDQDYLAIMYEGISSSHRQEIKFAVSLKPVASSLPGSTKHITTGTSELIWRAPEAEYKPRAVLDLARQDEGLQICPKTCGASNEDGAYRLVSGTRAAEEELPYMVRVAVDYNPRGYTDTIRITCGGSILNSRHVLTAAHCLLDKEKLGWDVVGRIVYTADYNDNDLNSHGQEISFDQFVVHPEYKSRMSDDFTKSYRAFDIAVLRLSEDILLGPNSWTICLAPGLDFLNKHATISGFGQLNQDGQERDGDQPSEGAWKAGAVIADYVQKCQEFDRFKLEDNSYRKACTFGMTKEACLGDMGSPLAVAENSVWYQVGVATGGFCGLPGEPHFHVNVTTFADFIRKNVRGGRCN